MHVAASATKVFDNVQAVFDDAAELAGQRLTVRGTFVQEAGAVAQLTDETNVIRSASTSVVDSDWAITLDENPVIRGLFEALPAPGMQGATDVRSGVVEITGTLTTKPRMMLSPPSTYLTIEPNLARIVPESELPGPDDFGGFIGG